MQIIYFVGIYICLIIVLQVFNKRSEFSLLRFLFILLAIEARGQYEVDYSPIPYARSFPAVFSENYEDKIKQAVLSQNSISKSQAKAFYEEVYYTKSKLISSGQIYFNNQLQEYVQSVAKNLLQNNQKLLSGVNVQVSRSTNANAFAMADGTIIINLGLLARLSSEAELAAIIAHEIAHVDLKHSLKAISKMENIRSQEENYENREGDLYRRLRFSREDESEADSRAIQIMMNSPYDPAALLNALGVLANHNYFKIDSLENAVRTNLLYDFVQADSSWFSSADLDVEDEKEKGDVVFSGNNEDRFSTHPNMDKRISATAEILKLVEYDSSQRKRNIMGDRSGTVQSIAIFECIENMLNESEYSTALYLALYFQKKYPKNLYIKTAIIRSLYWLSYYKEIDCLNKILENAPIVAKDNYRLFNHFLEEIPHNSLKKVMFSYAKQFLEDAKSKDEYFYYYGLASEMYLGRDPGKLIFNQYLLKFPNGKYTSSVKTRL